mmetsp:Transcript_23900/g.30421  ORF Transcript_23900/g.30421 Transcript_23900/m.30421 type:complete len:217 (-) Transcript_23900:582-1232(-)
MLSFSASLLISSAGSLCCSVASFFSSFSFSGEASGFVACSLVCVSVSFSFSTTGSSFSCTSACGSVCCGSDFVSSSTREASDFVVVELSVEMSSFVSFVFSDSTLGVSLASAEEISLGGSRDCKNCLCVGSGEAVGSVVVFSGVSLGLLDAKGERAGESGSLTTEFVLCDNFVDNLCAENRKRPFLCPSSWVLELRVSTNLSFLGAGFFSVLISCP